METVTFLGKKSVDIRRGPDGRILPGGAPQLRLNVPVLFPP